ALALMFAYPEDRALATRLSRLAREELRHFEQVDKLMQQHAVPYLRVKPGRYAAGLRSALRTHERRRGRDHRSQC
ncbi:MAG: tRNA-(ms[2]io[6]A)-hydroxylase, partial [Actinobacteria bacterium]|nr:tRNA-(ms[2]io[6]A)-hydroxylase [Actinomycetota bacterium]